MKQVEIVVKQSCTQPTVSRRIWRVQKWIAANWPDRQGELTVSEACRVSLVEHGIFLRHQQQRAMQEFEASCQPWRMFKTKTKQYPEGRKHGGDEIKEVHAEEYLQVPQRRAALLREARQAANDLTNLACGYLGYGSSAISIDEPLQKEERLKWKQEIEWRDKRMAEMEKRLQHAERQVTELKEAVRQAQKELALCGGSTGSQAPPGNPGPRGSASASSSEAEPRGSAFPGGAWERGVGGACESGSIHPNMREYAQDNHDITANNSTTCDNQAGAAAPVSGGSQTLHKNPRRGGHVVDPNAPEQQRLTDRDENPPPRRWPQAQYLEAIELLSRKHGLKGVDPYKISGIPDPKSMSPTMWIQKGLPYMLHIERDPPKLGPPRKPFVDGEEVH